MQQQYPLTGMGMQPLEVYQRITSVTITNIEKFSLFSTCIEEVKQILCSSYRLMGDELVKSSLNWNCTSGLFQYSLKRDGLLIQSSPTPALVSVPSSIMILAWEKDALSGMQKHRKDYFNYIPNYKGVIPYLNTWKRFTDCTFFPYTMQWIWQCHDKL